MSEFEYDRDPTMGMVSAEEFNAMAARAEKTEAALIAADKEIVELEAEAVALKADLARAVEERDDYRAKAIQRQRDFDGAAHACDVLQGKLDKVTEERDAALVLLKTLGAEHGRAWLSTASETAFNLLRERGLLRGERNGLVSVQTTALLHMLNSKPGPLTTGDLFAAELVGKLAAILAESEPGCEVCAERAREADESARFLSDVEEGRRILAESENEPPCRHGKDCIECEQEREPPSLPLGHEFIAYRGYFVESDTCIYLGCGQPRSAHEPKP